MLCSSMIAISFTLSPYHVGYYCDDCTLANEEDKKYGYLPFKSVNLLSNDRLIQTIRLKVDTKRHLSSI